MKSIIHERAAFALALAAAACIHAAPATSADALDNWALRSPAPAVDSLFGVAHGNGLFVAVGAYGSILTSPDGMNWTPQRSGAGERLFNVAYGNGLFVTGHFRLVSTSTDGLKWSPAREVGFEILSFGFGNGRFVAAGVHEALPGKGGVAIWTSTDGLGWTQRFSEESSGSPGRATAAYGDGKFIVAISG
jgi:hypothetical protein